MKQTSKPHSNTGRDGMLRDAVTKHALIAQGKECVVFADVFSTDVNDAYRWRGFPFEIDGCPTAGRLKIHQHRLLVVI